MEAIVSNNFSDDFGERLLQGPGGSREFDFPTVRRVATDRQKRSKTNVRLRTTC